MGGQHIPLRVSKKSNVQIKESNVQVPRVRQEGEFRVRVGTPSQTPAIYYTKLFARMYIYMKDRPVETNSCEVQSVSADCVYVYIVFAIV